MTRFDLDILPGPQRRLLPLLAPLQGLGYVLYGGTAIALQLGHRASIDFDFFTERRMDRQALRAALPWLRDAQVLQDEPDSWTVLAASGDDRPVKVSFFAELDFGRVGRPAIMDGIVVASLLDLLGHKLKVLLQRAETKDYRDIAAILAAGLDLDRGLSAAMALFPSFPPCEALRALVYFGDGDLAGLSSDERAVLVACAKQAMGPRPLSIVSASLGET